MEWAGGEGRRGREGGPNRHSDTVLEPRCTVCCWWICMKDSSALRTDWMIFWTTGAQDTASLVVLQVKQEEYL